MSSATTQEQRSSSAKGIDLKNDEQSQFDSNPHLHAAASGNDQTPESPLDDGEGEEEAEAGETTSLLNSTDRADAPDADGEPGAGPNRKQRWRWPSIIALTALCVVIILIIVFAFITPSVVREYARQAAEIETPRFALEDVSKDSVKIRVKVNGRLNAEKVKHGFTRNLGKFATAIGRRVSAGSTTVSILNDSRDTLALVSLPSQTLDIRNGHWNHLDIPSQIKPDDLKAIKKLAKKALHGDLKELALIGSANVPLKVHGIALGTHAIQEKITFEGSDIPTIPSFTVKRLNLHEIEIPTSAKAMAADVSISFFNEYPFDLRIPSLPFKMLVQGCGADDLISIAEITTSEVHVQPSTNIEVNAVGLIKNLPDAMTSICPESDHSPLDTLLNQYVHGKEAQVFVRGSDQPSEELPGWVTEVLASITVQVPFPGHSFDKLVKEFSLHDVHFKLPGPLADPGTPSSEPRISADVQAIVNLPEEMNFPIDVSRARADARVYYHGKHLGNLDLHKWQHANTTRKEATDRQKPELVVKSIVRDAPLNITDQDLFTEVIQALIFGDKSIQLGIKADVDVKISTALGTFVVRDLPAEGKVDVKPLSGGFGSFLPKVYDLQVLTTNKESLQLSAKVNFTNPTEYSAWVPYANALMMNNGSVLGDLTVENMKVVPGENEGIGAVVSWSPGKSGGSVGAAIGREFLSQYISGYNTTITVRGHPKSIPSAPQLSRALSNFSLTLPTPHLGPQHPNPKHPGRPHDPTREPPEYLHGATMHLVSSTANFDLTSPLQHQSLILTSLNATARYKGNPVGTIAYDLPFAVPPGNSTSPKIPVKWSVSSVGYEAVKKALGGTLKLEARAQVGVKIGEYVDSLWVQANGVGATVRL